MLFRETKLKGAYIIEVEKKSDPRGFFSRVFCKKEFGDKNLNTNITQASISFAYNKGTLRGLHYQITPFEEAKLIRCTRGSIYDVIVDLRPSSSTYKKWVSVNLDSESYKMLYVPESFAHGFLTLADNTEVFYQISQFYSPEHARGIRYDDPYFDIQWPLDVRVISDKDKSWPDFSS